MVRVIAEAKEPIRGAHSQVAAVVVTRVRGAEVTRKQLGASVESRTLLGGPVVFEIIAHTTGAVSTAGTIIVTKRAVARLARGRSCSGGR